MKVWISSLLAAAVSPRRRRGRCGRQLPDEAGHAVGSYPAGGSVDVTARILQGPLARELGQPVVVDNRAGAGGSIATAQVARAPADGYTVLFTLVTHHQSGHLRQAALRHREGLRARVAGGLHPQVLVAHPSFPPSSPG